jgi:hypothetical protein
MGGSKKKFKLSAKSQSARCELIMASIEAKKIKKQMLAKASTLDEGLYITSLTVNALALSRAIVIASVGVLPNPSVVV